MKVMPALIMLVTLLGAALTGCESKQPESAGQQTEQTMEQKGDQPGQAVEEPGQKREEAGEKTGN